MLIFDAVALGFGQIICKNQKKAVPLHIAMVYSPN